MKRRRKGRCSLSFFLLPLWPLGLSMLKKGAMAELYSQRRTRNKRYLRTSLYLRGSPTEDLLRYLCSETETYFGSEEEIKGTAIRKTGENKMK